MSTDAQYNDLLAAIRDAIDVPRAADYADERKFEALQRERVMAAVGTIEALLDYGHPVEVVTQVLRNHIRQHPVTYRPYKPAPDAQDSTTAVTQ